MPGVTAPGDEDEDGSPEDPAASSDGAVDPADDPMNPAAWYGEPGICGSCIAWRPEEPRPGEDVAAGTCKLRPELARVPATLTKCSIYKPRGQFVYLPGTTPTTRRRRTGPARVLRRTADGELAPSAAPRPAPRVRPATAHSIEEGAAQPLRVPDSGPSEPRPERPNRAAPREVELGPEANGAAVRQVLVELVRREHGRAVRDIHSKFRTGGKAIAIDANGHQVAISAERFFSFLDRYRSALDALENAIRARPGLGDEAEDLIGQVRRMQGSFTTFNVMFADREDYFSGKE